MDAATPRPYRVLGVHDGHDAGVALLEDGVIVYAANEERFSREKLHWGFPHLSLADAFRTTGLRPSDVHRVAVSGLSRFEGGELMAFSFDPRTMNVWKRHGQTIARLLGPATETRVFARFVRGIGQLQRRGRGVRSSLREAGVRAPVRFYDHHACHAATAYYTAATDPVLVVTADYSGDGVSGTISIGEGGRLRRVAESSVIHSAGRFWDVITALCGFKPTRHAGKITGLAAYRPSPEAHAILRRLYAGSGERLRFDNVERRVWLGEFQRIREVLPEATREELAYAAQKVLEEAFALVVGSAVARFGVRDIALAGGTFANVRLNQILAALPAVGRLHVFPNMGDGGLALGAAYLATSAVLSLRPSPLSHLYLGPSYPEGAIRAAASRAGLSLERLDDPASFIAGALAAKKVIGVFQGRMEYGPRALGNRSILAEPTDPTMMDWLNKRLKRTEFMPFAPIILEEEAPRYFRDFARASYPARFMTICVECTEEARRQAPGIVHRDGTARPQTVSRRTQPLLHAVLRRYQERTGLPLCINTSFNKHEEPIVCTPEDAVREFLRGGTDVLVLESFVARVPEPRAAPRERAAAASAPATARAAR